MDSKWIAVEQLLIRTRSHLQQFGSLALYSLFPSGVFVHILIRVLSDGCSILKCSTGAVETNPTYCGFHWHDMPALMLTMQGTCIKQCLEDLQAA